MPGKPREGSESTNSVMFLKSSILVFFLKLCIVWEVCKDRGDVGAAGDIGKRRGNVGEP